MQAVSHDLRTPLAGIKASVNSLRQPDVEWTAGETAEFLATVEDETDRLTNLVDNLLDMSRIQADAVMPALRPTTLDEVVPAALASLAAAPVTSSWMCRRAHHRCLRTLPCSSVSSPTSSTTRSPTAEAPVRSASRPESSATTCCFGSSIEERASAPTTASACSTRSNVSTTRASQRCRGRTGIGRRSWVHAGHARRAHGRRHTRGRHDDDRRARGLPMSPRARRRRRSSDPASTHREPASPQVRVGCRRDRRGRSPARRQAPSRRGRARSGLAGHERASRSSAACGDGRPSRSSSSRPAARNGTRSPRSMPGPTTT